MPELYSDKNTNFNTRPAPVDGIIIHAAGEYIDGVPAGDFMRKYRYSYHNLVHPDGRIAKAVSWDERAWHAGKSRLGDQTDLNDTFLGFCLLVPGNYGQSNWDEFVAAMNDPITYSDEQYRSLAWLCRKAMERHLDISFDRIKAHSEVSGPDVRDDFKQDPGDGFSFTRLFNMIPSQNGHS